jgi:hypothetical protein
MGGVFSSPKQVAPYLPGAEAAMKPPTPPRVVRMPTETDPSIIAAQQRTRMASMRRTGRNSTILTDGMRDTVGSSGQALGA